MRLDPVPSAPTPPPGPAPVGGTPQRTRSRSVAMVVVLALLAGVAGYALFFRDEASAVVVYEPPLAAGDDPFTSPVDVSAASVGAEIPTPDPSASESATPGSGPFGGSGSNTVCDRERLIRTLRSQPDRLGVWLDVLGVPEDDFERFVRSLTPVTLAEDTRVTNHGFKDGRAVPFQSILPAGTAVLVDDAGRIVVRCRCGNPILEPVRVGAASCRGCPGGYSPPQPLPPGFPAVFVVVVNPPPVTQEDGAATTPAPAETGAPPVAAPPTSAPTPPPQVQNLSLGASASASSTYSSEFSPSLSNDGSVSTSWFSAGPGGDGTSTYTLTLAHAATVTRVEFVGNEQHSNPEFRQGFGFGAWEIQLLSAQGQVLATVRSSNGTRSQSHDVEPVSGVTRVRFVGRQHQDPTCGGFAELRVLGY